MGHGRAGKGVSTDGSHMRRPALSGPENAERAEYVRQASGRNNKGNSEFLAHPLVGLTPLGPQPLPGFMCRSNPNRSCPLAPSPEFSPPSKSPSLQNGYTP